MTPFAIFFLRQFFLGINREIEEAAKLDGAGPLRIFFQIILPMSAAPITTLAILTFIDTWNDYLWPLLVGNAEQRRVLTVALGVFRSQTPAGSPRLGRPDGRDPGRRAPDPDPVLRLRPQDRQLDRLLRHASSRTAKRRAGAHSAHASRSTSPAPARPQKQKLHIA